MNEEWKVYQTDEVCWYLARSLEEAKATHKEEMGSDDECVEKARELTAEEMNRLKFCDDVDDPNDPAHWECECGARGDLSCRFNGTNYEHPHPYPIGHVEMTLTTRRTFAEELRNRIELGIKGPELFATKEH